MIPLRGKGGADPAAAKLMRASELHRTGDVNGAIAIYEEVLRAHPNHAEASRLMAMAACQLGDFTRAVHHGKRAVRYAPESAVAHSGLGEALAAAGQPKAAILELHAAIKLGAKSPGVMACLGGLLIGERDIAGAERWLDEALRRQEEFPPALFYKARIAREANRPMAAQAWLERFRATGVNPSVAWSNIGTLLLEQGLTGPAIDAFRRAVEIDPETPEAYGNLLHALLLTDRVSPADIFAEHVRRGDQLVQSAPKAPARPAESGATTAPKTLRIGYISPDFRAHPVAAFMEPILARHDRNRVHVVCYQDSPQVDATTQRLRKLAHEWREVAGFSDEALLARIADDRIDILVDLAVNSAANRQRLFASRAAPVQISYLGYAATTGLRTMDLRLTDATIDPPGLTESLHTERLLRLPNVLWCYQAPAGSPPIVERAPSGTSPVRFVSLSRLAKISDSTLDAWCEIMRAIPDAALMLQAAPFGEPAVRELWAARFRERNVDPARVEMRGAMPMREYLQRLGEADVALDTFPFNGGTTTCNSLWMGCPVVTLEQSTPWSRVSASILTTIGLPRFVAKSVDEYVATAIAIARDSSERAELRRMLRDRMTASPLMDGVGFTHALEDAFEEAWRSRA